MSKAQIETVSLDRSPAYWAAAIVFDRFHLSKLVNEKLDDLRRELVREATGPLQQTVKGVRQRKPLGKTLLGHASGILAWWLHRISNGRMGGINHKIITLLRQTDGLRDERFFTLKLYALHHSKLTLVG